MCNHCTFASTLLICRYFTDWKSDGDSYFTIDETEGTIATNELLDRESTAQYNFSIIASKVSKYGMDGINVTLQFLGFTTLKWVPAEVFFISRLTAEWSPGESWKKPVPFPHSISPVKWWQLPMSLLAVLHKYLVVHFIVWPISFRTALSTLLWSSNFSFMQDSCTSH